VDAIRARHRPGRPSGSQQPQGNPSGPELTAGMGAGWVDSCWMPFKHSAGEAGVGALWPDAMWWPSLRVGSGPGRPSGREEEAEDVSYRGPPPRVVWVAPWTVKEAGWGAVLRIRISAEFNGIAWSRLGSVPCNQKIASGFGAAGIEAVFFVILQFSAAPPLHSAVVARLEAAPARRSVPPSFTRQFRPPRPLSVPEPSKQSAAADGGAWKGNQSIGSSRWRGSISFKNRFARCAREFK
jgi:hypothetical protein